MIDARGARKRQVRLNGSSTTTQSCTLGSDAIRHPPRHIDPIFSARILFVTVLGVVAAILGYVAHDQIEQAEEGLGLTLFDSIASRALNDIILTAQQKRWSAITMASFISELHPNAEEYPFVIVKGFERMADNLLNTSHNLNLGFAPIVDSSLQSEWEAFAYQNNIDRPTKTSGRGIWGVDENNEPYRDIGNTSSVVYGSPFNILTPVIHTNTNARDMLLHNLHSDAVEGNEIDHIIECSLERSKRSSEERSDRDCGSITPMTTFLELPDNGPSSVTFTPVYPANDPTTLTGIIVAPILWSSLLNNAFADEVSGIDCVLEANGEVYTFTIEEGIPQPLGEGDMHDPRYDELRVTIPVTAGTYYTENSPEYTLTLYPSAALFDVYSTNNPTTAAVGAVFIIVFVSILFFLYDFLVHREFLAKQELLHAKRKFVRFLSHEVRTPLNAVCMGLTVIQMEMAQSLGYSSIEELAKEEELQRNDRSQDLGTVNERELLRSISGSSSKKTRRFSLKPIKTVMKLESSRSDDLEKSLRAEDITSDPNLKKKNVLEWFGLSREILWNTLSAVDVLSDVLNYDKIETGSLQLELAKIPIWELVESSMGEFRLSAQRKDIDLHWEFRTAGENGLDTEAPSSGCSLSQIPREQRDCKVIGDRVRIIQVLRNLTSNAIKFTPIKGSIHVVATWHRPTADNEEAKSRRFGLANGDNVCLEPMGHVTVEIHDTGAGLSPQQLECLFREGIQFNAAQLQQGQGSGFGLYIAKDIVEMHEGVLVAESEGLTKGTSFTMKLPLYHSPDQLLAHKKIPTHSLLSAGFPDAPSGLEVLVADDAVSNRKLLARLLEYSGHSCDLADDGDIAVQMVREREDAGRHYDAILLDYEMPRMNGPDAAKEMRQQGCESFIVGITGNMLPSDVNYYLSSGANAVLPKPLRMKDLNGLLMEHGISSQTPTTTENSSWTA